MTLFSKDLEPFFSVILPVYNGERYLRETIESVLRQTYKEWELVIVDDVSTDSTPSLIHYYRGHDGRVRSIRNEKNMNCGPSANEGIKIARGRWITRIDADDLYHPNYLETVFYKARHAVEKADLFLSSWVSIIDEKGGKVVTMEVPEGEKVRKMLRYENFIYHPATSYPKALWERVGGYPPVGPESDDRVLWRKFFEAGARLEVIPEALMDYRIHLGNMSFTIERPDFASDPSAQKAVRRHTEWKISLYLKQGLGEEARRAIRKLPGVSLKNRFFFLLSYFPKPVVSFFMWEIRPRLRHFFRSKKGRE